MHTQDFAVHDSCQGKEVKDLTTCLPNRRVTVLCLAFLVKAVDLGNLPGLVVAADQSNTIGEPRKSAMAVRA